MSSRPAADPILPFAVRPSPEAATPHTWTAALAARLDRRLEVAFGRSRSRPVLLQRRNGGWKLRLHEFFASADGAVVDAVAIWVARGRADRPSLRLLDRFIEAQLETLPPPPPARRAPPAPAGRHHDLAALAETLRGEPALAGLTRWPVLTWARRGPRPRRSLQLGLYVPETHTVRVHPVLDRNDVPAWFVRAILFHELLHAALPPQLDANGRWCKHGQAFRARERTFADHARADAWLARHIDRLLRLARRLD